MPHYYDEQQDGPFAVREFSYHLRERKFTFFTAPGVFSKDRVDKGTEVLANHMDIPEGGKVLDIGCGIGILGIVAAKMRKAHVVMSDVNTRAVKLARMNVKKNAVDSIIVQGDLYAKVTDSDFDVVLSNPPQNAGKDVCFSIIEGAYERLKPGGSLQLVARKNKGGNMLGKKIEEVFGSFDTLAKKGGYWVYRGTRG